MNRYAFIVITAAALAAIHCGPGDTASADLTAQNGSGISGTASLKSVDGGTAISVQITDKTDIRPTRIMRGKCNDVFESVARLNATTNGSSTTDVPLTLQALLQSNAYIIAVEASATDAKHIACGTIR